MISGLAGWFWEWADGLLDDGHSRCLAVGSMSAPLIQRASPGLFLWQWLKDSREEQKREKLQCTHTFQLSASGVTFSTCHWSKQVTWQAPSLCGKGRRQRVVAHFCKSSPKGAWPVETEPANFRASTLCLQHAMQFREVYGGKKSAQSHIY